MTIGVDATEPSNGAEGGQTRLSTSGPKSKGPTRRRKRRNIFQGPMCWQHMKIFQGSICCQLGPRRERARGSEGRKSTYKTLSPDRC